MNVSVLFLLAIAHTSVSSDASSNNTASSVENERYLDCVSRIEEDADVGRLWAQKWAFEGGSSDAHHCLALADIAAGFYKLGAARLEEIAERKDAGDDFVRARLLSQAAQTWLKADDVPNAVRTIGDAFALVPDAGELYLAAAPIYVANESWSQVIAAIDKAKNAGFESSDGYVQRARANIAFGDFETAANDVVSALNINPTNIDALVLRGEIQQTGVAIDVFFEDAASQ